LATRPLGSSTRALATRMPRSRSTPDRKPIILSGAQSRRCRC
jgi:hypothetical protein